jgi:N-acetylglucosaminyl-diphospho-decaprenol L-rhamnosyltransferase
MNKQNIFDRVTVIIVTFHSDYIIEKCLQNIDERFKKIIIENSNNLKFTQKLKNKFKNLESYNTGYDSGFPKALNYGFKLAETEYLISANPDSFPDQDCFEKLVKTADEFHDAALIAPATYKENDKQFKEYGYFKKKIYNNKLLKNNNLEVDWVTGNIFLIRKKNLNTIGYYDENIFLQYDDIDYCKRIFDCGKKIIINFNAKSWHLEGKSHNPELSFQMKCESSWHTSWSCYYFYKKHYGHLHALKKNITTIIKYLFCYIFNYLINNKKKYIYFLLLSGFLHSIIGKKSSYRALL